MAAVKIAPGADTPVVQGLIGALENVVGSLAALLLVHAHRTCGHSLTSYERSIS